MPRTRRLLPVALWVLATACGSSALGLSGVARLTIHQTKQADVTPDPWLVSDHTPVDPPPGSGSGFFGTCQYAGGTWTADISQVGAANGLARMRIVVADDSASATITATVGGADFAGTCTVAPNRWSEGHDLGLAAQCPGLALAGDSRTVDLNMAMTVENCTGP